MFQSTFPQIDAGSDASPEPRRASADTVTAAEGRDRFHVGIIMDGNGRWARRRGLPRTAGHRAGASAVRRTVAAAPSHGIGVLTLYAFSSDNWRRPPLEVRHLMRLLRTHLRSEAERCVDEGVRVSVIGRRDRLAPALVTEIESVEARTRAGRTLHLQLAIDYSSRDAILAAAVRAAANVDEAPAETIADQGTANAATNAPAPNDAVRNGRDPGPTREGFGRLISRALHAAEPIPDVDLVVRTGGERRLSDFLLWESAYAELLFTQCLWPDFDEGRLAAAMEWFARRERRYGGLVEPTRPAREG